MDNPNLRVAEQDGYLLLIGTRFDQASNEAVTVTRALDVEDEVNQLSVLVAYERVERTLGTALWPAEPQGEQGHTAACSPWCAGDHAPVGP